MNQASYGETSGFVPVTANEQSSVNGGGIKLGPCGPWPWLLPLINSSNSK
jgi:hypothetical protein